MYAFFGSRAIFGQVQIVLDMALKKANFSSEKTFLIQPKTISTGQTSFLDLKKDKALIETYLGRETKTSEENSNTG